MSAPLSPEELSPEQRAAMTAALARTEPATGEHVRQALSDALSIRGHSHQPLVVERLRRVEVRVPAIVRRLLDAEARVAALEAERHAMNEALGAGVAALVEKNRQYADLEARPLAWAEELDAKSLDNLLITLSQAADYEPMSGAIDWIHEVLAGFRTAWNARAEQEFAAEAGHGTEAGESR